MNNREARFFLEAYRPGGQDANDPEFSDALRQAGLDPALKAWFEAQQRFDMAVAARVQALPVPADLRGAILAGAKVSQRAPFWGAGRVWAIAALLAIFAGLGTWFTKPARAETGWQTAALTTLGGLVEGQEHFDMQSGNVADLQKWLRANGKPMAADVPERLRQLSSLGCKTVDWDGHPISLICFHGPGGELVHLAMTSRAGLSGVPAGAEPAYSRKGDWNTATWVQGDMAMMLATRAPVEQLHALLSLIPLL